MIGRIILGFLVAIAGFLITWKSTKVFGLTGRIDWAEKNLSGGTLPFIRLFGVIVILVGFAIITNLMGNLLEAFAGLFIRGN